MGAANFQLVIPANYEMTVKDGHDHVIRYQVSKRHSTLDPLRVGQRPNEAL